MITMKGPRKWINDLAKQSMSVIGLKTHLSTSPQISG